MFNMGKRLSSIERKVRLGKIKSEPVKLSEVDFIDLLNAYPGDFHYLNNPIGHIKGYMHELLHQNIRVKTYTGYKISDIEDIEGDLYYLRE